MFEALSMMPKWRRAEQLQGLQDRHPSVFCHSTSLKKGGGGGGGEQSSSSLNALAMHPSGNAAVASLTPSFGPAEFVVMSTTKKTNNVSAGSNPHELQLDPLSNHWFQLSCSPRKTRQRAAIANALTTSGQQMKGRLPCTSLQWSEDLLFVGSNEGKVHVLPADDDSCGESLHGLIESSDEVLLRTADRDDLLCRRVASAWTPRPQTCVSKLQLNKNSSSLLGVQEHKVFVWDLDSSSADGLPMLTHVNENERAHYSAATWLDESYLAVGSYMEESSLASIIDVRTASVVIGLGNDLQLGGGSVSGGGAAGASVCPSVLSMTQSPLFPNWVLCSTDESLVRLFDMRYPSTSVLEIPSLQGQVHNISWSKAQGDLFATGGIDGTIKLWSLRSSPTYCVGTLQFSAPISELVCSVDAESHQGAWVGLTACGELLTTGLTMDGVASLAPHSTSHSSSAPGSTAGAASLLTVKRPEASDNKSNKVLTNQPQHQKIPENVFTGLEAQEREFDLLLYGRHINEAVAAAVDCARARAAWRDHAQASVILERVAEPAAFVPLDIGAVAAAEDNLRIHLTPAELRNIFLDDLFENTTKIPHVLEDETLGLVPEYLREAIHTSLEHAQLGKAIEEHDKYTLKRILSKMLGTYLQQAAGGGGGSSSSIRSAVNIDSVVDAFTALKQLDFRACIDLVNAQLIDQYQTMAQLRSSAFTHHHHHFQSKTTANNEESGEGDDTQRAMKMKAISNLVKRIATVLCSPLISDGVAANVKAQKRMRKHQEQFLRNTDGLMRALPLLLEFAEYFEYTVCVVKKKRGNVKRPGGSRHPSAAEIKTRESKLLKLMINYEAECNKSNSSSTDENTGGGTSLGLMTWISRSAFLGYLHVLASVPNYAACVWTAARIIDGFSSKGFSSFCEIVQQETLSEFEKVVRTGKILEEKCRLVQHKGSATATTTTALVDAAPDLLKQYHPFMIVVCRATLQMSNVFEESGLEKAPLVVEKTMEKLNDTLDVVFQCWCEILEAVKKNRRQLLSLEDTIDLFAEDIDELVDISPDGDDDAVLGAILDECDDYLDLADSKR